MEVSDALKVDGRLSVPGSEDVGADLALLFKRLSAMESKLSQQAASGPAPAQCALLLRCLHGACTATVQLVYGCVYVCYCHC